MAAAADAQVDNNDAGPPSKSVTLDQISTGADAQLAKGGRTTDVEVPQPAQLSRTAIVTSSEISDRADGRTLAIPPATGTDRCDEAGTANRSQLCRQRLETRANLYSRPRSALVTPEARLLLLTNPNGAIGREGNGQLGSIAGLDAPNGPTEQLAGALRDRADAQSDSPATTPVPTGAPGTLPPSVSPIVVIPPR